jgi:hypothetical protein
MAGRAPDLDKPEAGCAERRALEHKIGAARNPGPVVVGGWVVWTDVVVRCQSESARVFALLAWFGRSKQGEEEAARQDPFPIHRNGYQSRTHHYKHNHTTAQCPWTY